VNALVSRGGAAKFTAHATEVRSFQAYGLPSPDLLVYLVGVVEVVGGAMLLIGLLVRLTALTLSGDMVGAILVSGLGRGELISLTLAPALLIAMLVLIAYGSGPWSLDHRRLPRHSRRSEIDKHGD